MAVVAEWDNPERTVVRLIYTGAWTWLEHRDAIAKMGQLMQQADHEVDLIIDVSAAAGLPQGAIGNLGATIKSPPPNWSKGAVVVSSKPLARVIMQAVMKVYGRVAKGQHYRFAETLEEARLMLLERQPA